MAEIKRALVSVSNKKGIVSFAEKLYRRGIEIISTGGTAKKIKEAGIPVVEISDITNFPEMMDGRVKTLHPAVHAGILGLRDNNEHMKELKEQEFKTIDLVVCNLYPFAETIEQDNVSLETAVENIDIGGPTMIRSAAKNFKDVTVVVDPADYKKVISELNEKQGKISYESRLDLAYKAFNHTYNYDQKIQEYFAEINKSDKNDSSIDGENKFTEKLNLSFSKKINLRYGENPHQKAAFYKEDSLNEPSITSAKQLHGKELSFNNINDTNGAFELIKEFRDKPAAAVIKHANPCGMAVADDLKTAYKKAHAGDPLSAFGSIVALNKKVTEEVAKEITAEDKFVEVVIAPGYEKDALNTLKNRWKNIRILKTGDLYINKDKPGYDMKKVTGGLLVQERDLEGIKSEDKLEVVTEKKPTKSQLKDLLFSWKVVKYVKSNAIVMAKDEMIVGVGAGQMSRVDAMIIAGRKAEGRQKDGVVASDAFFPFPDAIEEAHKKGIKAIIQPGGSVRDEEVIKRANELGIAMVFTGKRHFRH